MEEDARKITKAEITSIHKAITFQLSKDLEHGKYGLRNLLNNYYKQDERDFYAKEIKREVCEQTDSGLGEIDDDMWQNVLVMFQEQYLKLIK